LRGQVTGCIERHLPTIKRQGLDPYPFAVARHSQLQLRVAGKERVGNGGRHAQVAAGPGQDDVECARERVDRAGKPRLERARQGLTAQRGKPPEIRQFGGKVDIDGQRPVVQIRRHRAAERDPGRRQTQIGELQRAGRGPVHIRGQLDRLSQRHRQCGVGMIHPLQCNGHLGQHAFDPGGRRRDPAIGLDLGRAHRQICRAQVVERGIDDERFARLRIEGDREVGGLQRGISARDRQNDAVPPVRGGDPPCHVDQRGPVLRVEEYIPVQQKSRRGEAQVPDPCRTAVVQFHARGDLAPVAEEGAVVRRHQGREVACQIDVDMLGRVVWRARAAHRAVDPLQAVRGEADVDQDVVERSFAVHRQAQGRTARDVQKVAHDATGFLGQENVDPEDPRCIVEARGKDEGIVRPVEPVETDVGGARAVRKLRGTVHRQPGGPAQHGFGDIHLVDRDLTDIDADR
jgi:hypothetical protein